MQYFVFWENRVNIEAWWYYLLSIRVFWNRSWICGKENSVAKLRHHEDFSNIFWWNYKNIKTPLDKFQKKGSAN